MAGVLVVFAAVLTFYPPSRKVLSTAGVVFKGMLEIADEYNQVYIDECDR